MADIIVTSNNWPAPAKINLFLHITGRRSDGYHLLQTVFQFIDLTDNIDFVIRSENGLVLKANYSDINAEDDLIIRAARTLQQETGCSLGADIKIEKKIPMGGGLGGGSSNAATTLVALNKLWQLGLDHDHLSRIGVGLGADIPIFIHGHASWAEGVGDKLTSVNPIESNYLIIDPKCHVPTAEIFNCADLTRNTPAITIRDSVTGAEHNDCEPVVRRLYPEIAKAMDWLDQYAESRMTGTGACVFAAFDNRSDAEAILEKLPGDWDGFVTRGHNRSPLVERLQRAN